MLLSSALLFAQEKEKETFRFEFEQDSLEINVGQEKQITIRLLKFSIIYLQGCSAIRYFSGDPSMARQSYQITY